MLEVFADSNVVNGFGTKALRIDNNHFTVGKVYRLSRMLHNCRSIRGQDILVIADAQNQGASLFRSDEHIGEIRADNHQPVSTLQFTESMLNRPFEFVLPVGLFFLFISVTFGIEIAN